ncbi:MAG TPA: MetQ/NlpA family ABC transporter substrate-binding protein, partial [Myxococcota bacterium]|nr:MetQ/NlpA family ABC transporter substrate-binding protein [Myxococcota bacterium]
YSRELTSLSELKDKAKIAIPNDPTNEARALMMLEKEAIIRLDNPKNLSATVRNIVDNPKNIQFIEVDAAMTPRALEDVDAAIINTNYALQAKLSPLKDALVLESKDSPYTNILVIRSADKDRPELKALAKALTGEKMRAFILEKYKGAVIPAF